MISVFHRHLSFLDIFLTTRDPRQFSHIDFIVRRLVPFRTPNPSTRTLTSMASRFRRSEVPTHPTPPLRSFSKPSGVHPNQQANTSAPPSININDRISLTQQQATLLNFALSGLGPAVGISYPFRHTWSTFKGIRARGLLPSPLHNHF